MLTIKSSNTNLIIFYGVDGPMWSPEFVPLGAIALFASSNPDYHENVNRTVSKANIVYQEFLMSDEGKGFNGQV
jgi:hypothetical protein